MPVQGVSDLSLVSGMGGGPGLTGLSFHHRDSQHLTSPFCANMHPNPSGPEARKKTKVMLVGVTSYYCPHLPIVVVRRWAVSQQQPLLRTRWLSETNICP